MKEDSIAMSIEEVKKLIGKYISFKACICAGLDLRFRYTGEVIKFPWGPLVNAQALTNLFHYRIVPLLPFQIKRDSVKVLSEEETLIWKLRYE